VWAFWDVPGGWADRRRGHGLFLLVARGGLRLRLARRLRGGGGGLVCLVLGGQQPPGLPQVVHGLLAHHDRGAGLRVVRQHVAHDAGAEMTFTVAAVRVPDQVSVTGPGPYTADGMGTIHVCPVATVTDRAVTACPS